MMRHQVGSTAGLCLGIAACALFLAACGGPSGGGTSHPLW